MSLRLINHRDNVDSGGVWGRAVSVKGVKTGDKYLIIPADMKSFYYSNGKFGI